MNADFEQRLRSEMEQVAVRSRPDMVREAYRRYRSRRRTARTVAVTGTAAVAAAGTAVGLGGTAGSGTSATPAETTAYVVSHASSALSSANKIAYTYTHYTLAFPSTRNLDGPAWTYNGRSRKIFLTLSGKPDIDQGDTQTSYGDVEFWVNYPDKTWDRWVDRYRPGKSTTPAPDWCGSQGGQLSQNLACQYKTIIESGLRSGVFTVAGRQRIGGIDALKLVTRVREPKRDPGMFPTKTLWVDPSTFLPVQMQLNEQGHAGIASPGKADPIRFITVRFTWLPPTKANLALLTPPVPPGFRQVTGEP